MILYFITLFLLIAGIVTIIISYRKCCDDGMTIGALITAISGFFVLFVSIYMATRGYDGRNFQRDREYYQEALYQMDENTTVEYAERVIKRSLSINEAIELNKRHAYDPFIGCLYNKRKAETELIDIPKFSFKVTKEE
jgi:hypothetical protein